MTFLGALLVVIQSRTMKLNKRREFHMTDVDQTIEHVKRSLSNQFLLCPGTIGTTDILNPAPEMSLADKAVKQLFLLLFLYWQAPSPDNRFTLWVQTEISTLLTNHHYKSWKEVRYLSQTQVCKLRKSLILTT